MKKPNQSRRDFVKKAAYVAPAIVSLKAAPAFAARGSDRRPGGNGNGNGRGNSGRGGRR